MRFETGDIVIATPLDNDVFHQFEGTIVTVNCSKQYADVKDSDDDVYSVNLENLELA